MTIREDMESKEELIERLRREQKSCREGFDIIDFLKQDNADLKRTLKSLDKIAAPGDGTETEVG